MLTLYTRAGCAYTTAVIHELAELGLEYEEKDISDPEVAKELVEIGGDLQVPFLLDSEHMVGIYESGDIVEYLAKTYCGDVEKKKGPDAPDVCISK